MPRFPDERSPVVDAADTQAQTLLGKGSRVEGKLTFDGSVRVDGEVDGEIDAQESVLIGETAVVSAQIRAKRARSRCSCSKRSGSGRSVSAGNVRPA